MNRLEATYLLSKIITPYDVNLSILKHKILKLNRSKWEIIINIANNEGIIPLLYASLKQKDLLIHIKDEQLLGYLKEIYKLNETRNNAIIKQITNICDLFSKKGIKPVLLKGVAALSENHYKYIGSRIMTDIDIYIPNGQIYKAIDILKKNGYFEIDPEKPLRKNWHDYRRMYKNNVYAAVELHRYLLLYTSMPYFPQVELESLIRPSATIQNAFVLCPKYELYHSFLHSEVSNSNYRYKHIDIRHQQHFSQMQYKYQINLKQIDDLIDNKYILKAWNSYCCIQYEFFHANKNKNINCKKHLKSYKRKLKSLHPYFIMSKNIFTLVIHKIKPESIQKHYSYKYKIMYFFYLIHYISTTFLEFLFQKEKRNIIIDNLKYYL